MSRYNAVVATIMVSLYMDLTNPPNTVIDLLYIKLSQA